MWRQVKLVLWLAVLVAGILVGAAFVTSNPAVVNVQFPFIQRESGEMSLGLGLLVAATIGMALALVLALVGSVGVSLHVASLRREIRNLRKEVDALRNLPLLEEEIDEDGEGVERVGDGDDSVLDGSRGLDVASGPVRGGSTAAPIGGDDDEDEDRDSDVGALGDDDEDAAVADGGSRSIQAPPSGTRKIDV